MTFMSEETNLTQQPREMLGKLSIGRPQGSGEEYMKIELVDDTSRIEFLELRISLDNFMKALTGQGYTPCYFETRGLEKIGMVMEHKTELVPVPEMLHMYSDPVRKDAAINALRKFEVDGWQGRVEDLFNHHNAVRGIDVRHITTTQCAGSTYVISVCISSGMCPLLPRRKTHLKRYEATR